eukprot:12992410-Alexandrium_andersonii.AAC.1
MTSVGPTASQQAGPRTMRAQCRACAAEASATGSRCGGTEIPILPRSSLQTARRPCATCWTRWLSSRPRARKAT